MIYTSYFSQLNKLPNNFVVIAICSKVPQWYTGLQYKKLAPKYDFFMKWKQDHDNDQYIRCFNDQVLKDLDPTQVVKDLVNLAKSTNIVLVCYEKPNDFCHRHLVASWLSNSGYYVNEWSIE